MIKLPSKAQATFPILNKLKEKYADLMKDVFEPARKESAARTTLLEAKVEYLLDEVYRIKAMKRYERSAPELTNDLWSRQTRGFDYQWTQIRYHDSFLTNESWKSIAVSELEARTGLKRAWFEGKKILDAGCGPGRWAWVFAQLGADVVGVDASPGALQEATQNLSGLGSVRLEKRSVLEPLPFDNDFDMVWSFGVLHHTVDAVGALKNVAQHVKDGGYLYVMLYSEPRRSDLGDYAYRHQVSALREVIRFLPYERQREIFESIEGPTKALGWFDAVTTEINETFTFEEISSLYRHLGFSNVTRTMPDEPNHNVIGQREAK